LNRYIDNIKNPKTSKKLEKEVAFKELIADSDNSLKVMIKRQHSVADKQLISVVKHRQNALNKNIEGILEDEKTEIIAAEQGRTWQLEKAMVTYKSAKQTSKKTEVKPKKEETEVQRQTRLDKQAASVVMADHNQLPVLEVGMSVSQKCLSVYLL
jgi:hypothetical protein